MIDKMFHTKNLRLAKMKYFDSNKGGIELNDLDVYAILMKAGNTYVNIFDLTDNLPVFERVPYSNTTREGFNYGTKVIQLSGEEGSGVCYVLETAKGEEVFGEEDISQEQLSQYILHSNLFFIDRQDIIREKPTLLERAKYLSTYLSDLKKTRQFQSFIDSHEDENISCK